MHQKKARGDAGGFVYRRFGGAERFGPCSIRGTNPGFATDNETYLGEKTSWPGRFKARIKRETQNRSRVFLPNPNVEAKKMTHSARMD